MDRDSVLVILVVAAASSMALGFWFIPELYYVAIGCSVACFVLSLVFSRGESKEDNIDDMIRKAKSHR